MHLCNARTKQNRATFFFLVLVVSHSNHGHALPVERATPSRSTRPSRSRSRPQTASPAAKRSGRQRRAARKEEVRQSVPPAPSQPFAKANVPSRRIRSRSGAKPSIDADRDLALVVDWEDAVLQSIIEPQDLRRRWHLAPSARSRRQHKTASSTAAADKRIQGPGSCGAWSACSTPASFRPLRMTAITRRDRQSRARRREADTAGSAVAFAFGRQVREITSCCAKA